MAMIAAAMRYFGFVFAIAFAIGVVRTLWLAPAIGATAATLVELPIILLASWAIARRIVTGRRLFRAREALSVGAIAFAMLMATEALLALALAGQSATQWASNLLRTPGWIGLAGQALFGLMPWLVVTFTAPRRRGALPPFRSPEN